MSGVIGTAIATTYCVGNQMKNGDGQGMWHVWGITEMHTGVCWGNLRERDHLEDLEVDRTIILKWILNIMGERGLD